MQFLRSLSFGSNGTTRLEPPRSLLSLHAACAAGDVARVRELLDEGAAVHSRDEHGRSPLQCALATALAGATSRLMVVLQALASHGAQWDVDCDALIIPEEDDGRSVGAALRACFTLWTDEHARAWPLTDVPIEVVRRGAETMQVYLDSLAESAREPLRRRKVCIVGPRKCGKTVLVHALVGADATKSQPVERKPLGVAVHNREFSTMRASRPSPHELTLWDFDGGDDETMCRLAALLTTPRCLSVVCVDAQALVEAAAMVAPTTAEEATMDGVQFDALAEFVDAKVLPWVPSTASSSQGMIALALTKMDLVRDTDEITIKHAKTRVGERIQSQLKTTLEIRWLAVSCKEGDDAAIGDAKTQFETLVAESDRSFVIPKTFATVLGVIHELRAANAKIRKSDRAAHQFIPVTKLKRLIRDQCIACDDMLVTLILQTFHDLGDLLWFDDGPKPLRDVVILDPTVFLDFARVVVEATRDERNDEVMPHGALMGLELWNNIDDVATATLKQLMVKARLAYAPRGEAEWDSDLIVPAYWKTQSAWETSLPILALSEKYGSLKPHKYVRWQYHFVGPLPRDFFEKVLVESYSPLWGRTIARNGIVFETEDESEDMANGFACRLGIDETVKDQCVVHLSAVASVKDAPSWWLFQYAAEAIEKVLDTYEKEEVWVSRCALNHDDEPHRLETVVAYWDETSAPYRAAISWLPPDVAWYNDIMAKRSDKAT